MLACVISVRKKKNRWAELHDTQTFETAILLRKLIIDSGHKYPIHRELINIQYTPPDFNYDPNIIKNVLIIEQYLGVDLRSGQILLCGMDFYEMEIRFDLEIKWTVHVYHCRVKPISLTQYIQCHSDNCH